MPFLYSFSAAAAEPAKKLPKCIKIEITHMINLPISICLSRAIKLYHSLRPISNAMVGRREINA